jgi:hypothetical protein
MDPYIMKWFLLKWPTSWNWVEYFIVPWLLYMFRAIFSPIIRSSLTIITASGFIHVCRGWLLSWLSREYQINHDSSRPQHTWIKAETVMKVKLLLMVSENIARNVYSRQGTINYSSQFQLVGHFSKNIRYFSSNNKISIHMIRNFGNFCNCSTVVLTQLPYISTDNAHLMYNAHPQTFSTFLLMYR